MQNKRILVAALNWGLGHATRAIPIIDTLLDSNVQVFLASDGASLELWRQRYPTLHQIELPSYNIHYHYNNMFLNMGLQMPKIIAVINKERRFISSIIQRHKIDALISDNRYGIHHPKIPSIFLTHQIQPIIPSAIGFRLVKWISQRIYTKFDYLWIPDYPDAQISLSGKLSHGVKTSVPLRYLGPLSRLYQQTTSSTTQDSYHITALLSGPEPQRSYFEQQLEQQLSLLPHKSLIVQGLPLAKQQKIIPVNQKVHKLAFLNGSNLAQQLQAAQWVIARSGYSSLMDFAQLGIKHLLLVPTPGQTEQIYLAQRLAQKYAANYQKQKKLDLKIAWQNKEHYKMYKTSNSLAALRKAVQELLYLKK